MPTHTLRNALILLTCLLLAGCTQPPPVPDAPQGEAIRLVQFAAPSGNETAADYSSTWNATITHAAVPAEANPADYGANQDGERWEDAIIRARSYALAPEAAVTTHTHGIAVFAEQITIDGRVNVRNLGAQPGQAGYSDSRAATLALYRGYGETDPDTGEPRIWGNPTDDCPGGGYIILNAPTIHLNGELDAGSDCAQGGIVYLEGTVTGTGIIRASLIIHRGAA